MNVVGQPHKGWGDIAGRMTQTHLVSIAQGRKQPGQRGKFRGNGLSWFLKARHVQSAV